MRLFVDAHTFDKEFQGTRTFLKGIYTEVMQQRPDIELFFASRDIKTLQDEFGQKQGVTYLQYQFKNSFSRMFVEIPRMLKKHKIDVAHFQYIAPWRRHCKYIVTTHDILFNDFPKEFSFLFRVSRNFIFRRSIMRADIKTTVSNYSVERIAHHYGLDKNCMHVIPNGVSEKFFEPFNKSGAQQHILSHYGIGKFILYVSRIEPRKNNAGLLKAFLSGNLAKQGIWLVFIGKTSIESKGLEALVLKMTEEEKEHFRHIEQVDDNELLKFYQAASLFVYPSKAEGFGIPPLEAGALNVPVMCSNKTAMQEYSFFGSGLFSPDNETELAEKIPEFLAGRLKNGDSGVSEIIRVKYNWANSARKLISLLDI